MTAAFAMKWDASAFWYLAGRNDADDTFPHGPHTDAGLRFIDHYVAMCREADDDTTLRWPYLPDVYRQWVATARRGVA